jgi:hypothetical protein|tara:strand:+ start:762 stop:1109 length:348 start_codon:yes stop_codon:yes gene_type:complete
MTKSTSEKLMNTLISKMESMDFDLQLLKAENVHLKQVVNNPLSLLRKAGFVQANTPLSQDISTDVFRGDITVEGVDGDNLILKDSAEYSNEEIHLMSWEEIHEMAEQTKDTEAVA